MKFGLFCLLFRWITMGSCGCLFLSSISGNVSAMVIKISILTDTNTKFLHHLTYMGFHRQNKLHGETHWGSVLLPRSSLSCVLVVHCLNPLSTLFSFTTRLLKSPHVHIQTKLSKERKENIMICHVFHRWKFLVVCFQFYNGGDIHYCIIF